MFVESPHQRNRTATASPPQGIVPQVVHTNAFRVNRNSAPRTAALPEMATVVLILDEERKVEYINDSRLPLFPLEDPIGCTLPALFMSSAISGGDHIFGTLDAGNDPTTRLRLSDGRLLDCTLRTLSSGGFVLSLDDVTAYVRNAEQAERDALTGLPNRKAFRDRLKERLACEPICAFPTAILYLDLDRFKAVNDTLGHLVGDTLLKKVAQRFKSALREGDMLARLGGDEFAIIQSNVQQPAAAIALANRLIDLIGRAYAIDGHILHIGASVGIALSPDDGVEPNVLLRNADLALYRAKEEGRSCYRFFEVGMNERMQSRRTMEIDLRRALAFKELQLEYQPQIDLATNAVAGFEALIRWRHPDRGLVQPSEFIPLAEEIGVIVPIGEWVLRTACNQAAEWPSHISLAVNLSPVQFRQGKILETVVSALAQSGLSPERLELEITEGALLEDADVVIDVLNKLRDLGVRISMDDFGTGYSSISYLQKFPFDAIKIDQCFVRDIDTRTDRKAIVGTIIGLAQALGMKTIAEGVETEAELSCIRVAGCDMVQGFLTGRPLSAAASVAVLQPII